MLFINVFNFLFRKIDMGYKNYKNQDFKSLRDECKSNGRLFEDPEFPTANSSLYFSKQPPFTAEWKRPKVSFL